MAVQNYIGDELELFANADNWKRYYATHVTPYLTGEVLEVGAGLGGTTRWILTDGARRWVCLEPDPDLARRAREAFAGQSLPSTPEVVTGTLDDMADGALFDAIAYIDVLEHIDDDRAELRKATQRLRSGGHLVILSPAFEALYSEFDRHIGHFRRYTKASLRAVVPPGLECVKLVYLDTVGALLSLGNRLLLRSSQPTLAQVQLWNDHVIPISRMLDPLLRWTVGKTVIGVWKKR